MSHPQLFLKTWREKLARKIQGDAPAARRKLNTIQSERTRNTIQVVLVYTKL